MNLVLQIEGLSRTYLGPGGDVRAVDDVSLTIGAREFVAIQGPSGCGKTTLLLAAGALLRPTGGRVAINGEDPYALSSDHRAQFRAANIGFVFQQFHLVPYLDVLENIASAALAVRVKAGARDRAAELAGRFGLGDRLRHLPAALSTCERQRVALARALLNQPKLLLADEPTGNLDAENGEAVMRYLAGFAKEGGSVLLVTHATRAGEYADRVIRMNRGRIEAAPLEGLPAKRA
jgi:ABC-type lipoprotein export system ATPase subunit